jgi:hypothetical protein
MDTKEAFVDVFANDAVARESGVALARERSRVVEASGLGITIVGFCDTFVDVCASSAIAGVSRVA